MRSSLSDLASITTMKRKSIRKEVCCIARYVRSFRNISHFLTSGQYELQEPKSATASTEDDSSVPEPKQSRSQQDKLKKLRRKAQVVIDHVDIIKDDFWERRPWILSNKPGKLPAQT